MRKIGYNLWNTVELSFGSTSLFVTSSKLKKMSITGKTAVIGAVNYR